MCKDGNSDGDDDETVIRVAAFYLQRIQEVLRDMSPDDLRKLVADIETTDKTLK